MLQSELRFSIPGKVFIFGEYAVLAGLPALVAAVGPRFSVTAKEGSLGAPLSPGAVPSASPLGRLMNWASQAGFPLLEFEFSDPYLGAGGFGASTAQFALSYAAYTNVYRDSARKNSLQSPGMNDSQLNEIMSWKTVWNLYRELVSGENVTPSGADLIAQWQGGVVLYRPQEGRCTDVWPVFNWSNLLVFSATRQQGRKVPTHHHLAALSNEKIQKMVPVLEEIISEGVASIQDGDIPGLGLAMDHYAGLLKQKDLELAATTEDRTILRQLAGVVGVKGTGALQADAVLVLMHPSSQRNEREKVVEVAHGRGLQLVVDGLDCQMGIRKC